MYWISWIGPVVPNQIHSTNLLPSSPECYLKFQGNLQTSAKPMNLTHPGVQVRLIFVDADIVASPSEDTTSLLQENKVLMQCTGGLQGGTNNSPPQTCAWPRSFWTISFHMEICFRNLKFAWIWENNPYSRNVCCTPLSCPSCQQLVSPTAKVPDNFRASTEKENWELLNNAKPEYVCLWKFTYIALTLPLFLRAESYWQTILANRS